MVEVYILVYDVISQKSGLSFSNEQKECSDQFKDQKETTISDCK